MSESQAPANTFTVETAAMRVNRSVRTIERWIAEEDLEVITIHDRNGGVLRYEIDEASLMTTYRAKLTAPRGGKGKPRRHA